jgi:uncharacterized membrane protein
MMGTGRLHKAFEISLLLKAVFALAEIAGGVIVYATTQRFWIHVVNMMTDGELAEDPQDLVANTLRRSVLHWSGSSLHFAAWYLFGHGVVKLWLIGGLLRRRLGYYPVAMVVFGLFAAYQLYRFTLGHAVSLLLVTVLDVLVIVLTWYEFRALRAGMATSA